MHSMFDDRQWLAWLVKVRIIILTFLLGIELAVARFTASSLPLGLFVSTILLWYTISVFYVLLLSFWEEYRIRSLARTIRSSSSGLREMVPVAISRTVSRSNSLG